MFFFSFFLLSFLLCSPYVSTIMHKHMMGRWWETLNNSFRRNTCTPDRLLRIVGSLNRGLQALFDCFSREFSSHGSETRYEHDCKSVNMLMKTRGSLTFEISMPDYIASWKRVAVPISIPIGMRAPSYFLRSLSRFLESFANDISQSFETSSFNLDWKMEDRACSLVEEENRQGCSPKGYQAKVFPARLVCKEKSINEPFRSFQGI